MRAKERVTGGFLSHLCRQALVTLGLLLAAAGARAQVPTGKVTVADVVVYGNRNVATNRIMGQIRTRPGMVYNQAVVDEDVRRLIESHLLADVRVWVKTLPDGRVVVNFNCTEFPSLVREIVYKNAHHLKPDELDTLTGLRKGMPLNPSFNKQACFTIQQRYKEEGRLFASVILEEGGNPGDSRVVFNITEGPKVKIRKISCVGGNFVSEQRLKTQVDSSAAFLHLLGGTYNPGMVDHDTIKLEEYYHGFGFLEARVTRELVFSDDGQWVDVIFHIHEGPRYQVSQVAVEGAKALDRSYVMSLTSLHSNDYYNKHTVDKDQAKIKDAYGWRGYEAVVQEQVTADVTKPGFVRVNYEVQEKPPARVGQIIIIGNTVTQDRVIRQEINLFPGQVLSYPELRLAERNLAKRGIFEVNPENGVRPTVTPLENDTDNPYKDILVQVQETHTGSLMFGVGVNSDLGLVGSIVLNERNFDLFRPPTSWADIIEGRAFRGAGEEFRLEAVPGTQVQRYTATFREPHLFDTQYALTESAYFYDIIFNEYTERRVGDRITIDKQLNNIWTASAWTRVEQVSVKDFSIFAPPEITNFAGENFQVLPGFAVRRDTRDSYLRPTEGSLLTFSYEQGLGDYTFPLVNIEGSKYWTIFQRPDGSGRQVLALHSQIAYAGANTPVYERFYAGGFRSLRGFEFRGVGPVVNTVGGTFEVGGDFMLLNSLEYQIPIRANDNLYMVAFVDSGTVESQVEIKDYRVSAGIGVRIAVPMLGPVPIALDFGFPIVKGPYDSTQVFSFWVGMFR